MGPWTYLAGAIALEIVATTLLKMSDGFEKTHWGIASIVCYSACFWLLAPALKTIPVGVAYAIWSGVGIVAIALIGLTFFGQKLSLPQLGFMAMLLVGAVGLRLTTAE